MKAFLTTALAALALASGVFADDTPVTTTAPPASTAPTTTEPPVSTGPATTAPAGGEKNVSKLNPNEYHMSSVRSIQARVQSDAPKWDEEHKVFVSSFGKTFADKYRGAMDTVNTASVEGALMYVQAEGIDVSKRSEEQKCFRKSNMTYVVFYDITFAQTNETLAQYQDDTSLNEYGPMVPMDGGRCTPVKGEELPDVCYTFSGENGFPNVGPFVGGESKSSDVRAPYPNTIWFSFPNTAPTKAWKEKTDANRAATRKGLCDFGQGPNGVDCTFSYTILGYIALDDVIGITSMDNNETGAKFKDFHEFCTAGNVEFTTANGGSSLPFWENPLDEKANSERAQKLIDDYQAMVSSGAANSTLVSTTDIANMKALPQIAEVAAANPPCYKNVNKCNATGCKRLYYASICTPCDANEGCPIAPSDFKFPALKKAEGEKLAPSMNETNSTSAGGKSDVKKSGKDDKTNSGAGWLSVQLAGTVLCALVAVLTL